MAKGMRAAVPVMGGQPEVELPESEPEVEIMPEDTLAGRIRQQLASDLGKAYRSRHVEFQSTPEQSDFIARLRTGLNANAIRLANGRFVQTAADAVRWLIEQAISTTTSKVVCKNPASEVSE